jgi:predicted acyltransferase
VQQPPFSTSHIQIMAGASLPATPSPGSGRLRSLDAFRGLTIVAMILVNNPGSWNRLYAPLAHAEWHGWTPTDLIFPFFLFIVGTSLSYSLRKFRHSEQIEPAVYWRIARRTFLLLLLGLGLGISASAMRVLFGQSDSIAWATLRLPGVLQRIALVYLLASLIVLHVGLRGQMIVAAALLLGYWAMLGWLPDVDHYWSNLSPDGNVVRIVDLALLGKSHLYARAATDPEGVLSTLPAVATTLMGYWAGLFIQRRKPDTRMAVGLIGLGLACTLLALMWEPLFPINKKIWTSSYVLLCGGLAAVGLALCLWTIDVKGWRWLAHPLEIVGVNAIFVFVASGLMARLLSIWQVGDVSVKGWLYQHLLSCHQADEKLASLAYAVATITFWWLILWAMAKRGWTIRV